MQGLLGAQSALSSTFSPSLPTRIRNMGSLPSSSLLGDTWGLHVSPRGAFLLQGALRKPFHPQPQGLCFWPDLPLLTPHF